MTRFTKGLLAGIALLIFAAPSVFADDVYARIKGTVVDTTGAVVPEAQVTATNTQTGVGKTITSRGDGSYEFLQLPIGPYSVSVTKNGFKSFKSTNIVLTVNQIYELLVKLEVGSTAETLEVKANSVQVETTSIQQSTLINSQQIVDLPLNGRNFTDLEKLAPGVQNSNDRFGSFSVNGSQSNQSNYLINGLDTNDVALNVPQILPSPDAIQEFNLIDSTINPEYGRNSGGIVNALIKNGTNTFHGSVFDFYRDSFLNARGFFSPVNTTPLFHQNQFGGTFGGPIWKDKTFFFLSYQGTYNATAGLTGAPQTTPVFSAAQRSGLFPDIAGSTGVSPIPLVDSNGVTQPAGTSYSALFPTGQIPAADINPISLKLMNMFVPLPNAPGNIFSFNAVNTLKANQGIMRIDHNITQNDLIWGTYIIEDAPTTEELPFIGSTLPGFGEVDTARTNDIAVDWNHTFSPTALNEVRLGYAHINLGAVNPQTPTSPDSLGFTNINPASPASGLPTVGVAGLFSLGFSQDGPQPRKDTNYQFTDNFTKIIGKHSLKLGVDIRRFQVDNPFFFDNNGFFGFNGGGTLSTGDPGADFLLGFPTGGYAQSSGSVINARAYEYYAYFQDQWKIKNNLTLTLGAGYDIETPYRNKQFAGEAFNCFSPGAQSAVFPTAPQGLLFPGDREADGSTCTNSGTRTHLDHVAPRVGFAYSPNLGRISGGNSNKFSIRGGFGIYFNRFEEETALQNLLAPPFGLFSTGAIGSPLVNFANPFQDLQSGAVTTNQFPFTFPKPGDPVNFAALGPQTINVVDPRLTTPYSMNFNLNIQRQFPGNTVMTLGYVGSLGRHLFRTYEANPITAAGRAACLAGVGVNASCVPFALQQDILFPDHLLDPASFPVPGTPEGVVAALPSVGVQATDGNSVYHALQLNVTKNMTHGLQLITSYTWSHAIDDGSGFEDTGFGFRGLNLINPALNRGSSSFDARQRLVIGYVYEIPSLHSVASWAPNPIFGGWKLSGITTFQSGFPFNLTTQLDTTLSCSTLDSKYGCGGSLVQVTPTVALLNPKTNTNVGGITGNFYFNPADFTTAPVGQLGNVARNSIVGPGYANFDAGFGKVTKIRERAQLEFGIEAFNLFNHTNFLMNPPGSTLQQTPNGVLGTPLFGQVNNAFPGRIMQLRAKVIF